MSTYDLAKGVFVGALLSGIFFAHKVDCVVWVHSQGMGKGRGCVYTEVGQIFFASFEALNTNFDYKKVIEKVRIALMWAGPISETLQR